MKYQDIFCYPQLKEIRYLVCKSIFQESIHHEIEELQTAKYIVKEDNKYFKLVKVQESWKCICSYFQKTGILCSYLVKITLVEKLRLSGQIQPRWKIDHQKEKKKSYQYQKKTRIN